MDTELPIPFREDPPELPDSRMMAEKRLQSLGKRFSKDPKLFERYKEGIHDLLQKGYAEEVVDDSKPRVEWYIPHHAVISKTKPDKTNTLFTLQTEANHTAESTPFTLPQNAQQCAFHNSILFTLHTVECGSFHTGSEAKRTIQCCYG